MAVKKFRRIRFGDSKQWRLLHPQNKTLLFAQDINGYWCKEHRKGMPRIQAVISHYRHNHNGAKITDVIEFQEIISGKSGKVLSMKKQKEKENRIMIARMWDKLKPKGPIPDWVRNSKSIVAEKDENWWKEDKWWETDVKKVREAIIQKISNYELFNKAKEAGMPKSELDAIKIQLGIQTEDTDDKFEKMLAELYRMRKSAEQ